MSQLALNYSNSTACFFVNFRVLNVKISLPSITFNHSSSIKVYFVCFVELKVPSLKPNGGKARKNVFLNFNLARHLKIFERTTNCSVLTLIRIMFLCDLIGAYVDDYQHAVFTYFSMLMRGVFKNIFCLLVWTCKIDQSYSLARRQSGVIGKRGIMNNIWEAENNFTLEFVSKGRKKFKSQIGQQGSGQVARCWSTIFERGHDPRLVGGGSRRDSKVRILIHAHRFRDEGKKKRSLSRNLRLCHSIHPCFCPRTKVYLRLGEGEQAVFFGGHRTQKALSATGPVHIFCLGGTSND